MIVGLLMDLIDASIVNVALPTIRVDLSATGTALEWVVSAYLLAFASVLITTGRLGDRFGRKRLFLVGVACFGLGSLGCGLAQNAAELIACRVVQGLAAATMTPQVLATFRALFDGQERGAVFSIYGAIAGLAVAVGLLLGGILTDADIAGLRWRAIFLVNVPLALVVLLAGARWIPEARDMSAPPPDLPGVALLSGSLAALVYTLQEGRTLGWPIWLWIVGACAAAGLLGLAWMSKRREGRAVPGLLPVHLFRVGAYSAGTLVQLCFSGSMSGFFFILTLWLQAGEGVSPLLTGLTAVAFSIGTIALAGVSVPLAVRFGRRTLVAGGLLLALGIIGLDGAVESMGSMLNLWAVVPGLVVGGAGLALLVLPLANVVMAAIPSSSGGPAAGVLSTAQQLGGAIGVAIIGEIFFANIGAGAADAFRASFEVTAPVVALGYLACALLSLALPPTAVADAYA